MGAVADRTWPGRDRVLDLAHLEEVSPGVVAAVVARLREFADVWAVRYLALVRKHVPEYAVLSDTEILQGARSMLDDETVELASLRLPDDVLLTRLEAMGAERAARGIPSEAMTRAYQLASRELLILMDAIAEEVDIPHDVLLKVHDSTWEFANRAAAVFARVERDLSIARARSDAERRSSFARGVLSGGLTADQVRRDAPLFGLDPEAGHLALAARASSTGDVERLRRTVASSQGMAIGALVLADMGAYLGFIVRRAPRAMDEGLIAVGGPARLDALAPSFEDAVLALTTAERFGMDGVVGLDDLGPRPLVLAAPRVAACLRERHLTALEASGRAGREAAETVRVLLECDQQVDEAAIRLSVHPNTVRYRLRRFRELTSLDVHRTRDLVTAWWLLNSRREASATDPDR